MKPFTTHTGVAAPLIIDNVDTDQIIPSREMKRVSKLGLGDGLFAGWRYDYEDGERTGENESFVLNEPRYRDASILLSGKNFGCGSSREHAVWALLDFGIRVVIAESFGRIFRNNCARNGLLTIELSASDIERIRAEERVIVDLVTQRVELPIGGIVPFSVDSGDREMLLNGQDYIEFALQYADEIDDFVAHDRQKRPWAYLAG